jgi:hypothetical protein
MKASTIILAALFTLQVSVLFAGNESTALNSTPIETTLDLLALVPSTPAEATFEEVNIEMFDFTALAPIVPAEADFEDMAPVVDLESLAPVTPAEADFSDGADQLINVTVLAPVTPMFADFE